MQKWHAHHLPNMQRKRHARLLTIKRKLVWIQVQMQIH